MKIHIVKTGDTLYELAQKYHVELDKLIASNPHIVNPDQLEVGMKVKIPTAPKPLAPAEGTYKFKHVVKQGDTLWKLSKAWDVPLADLIAANPQLKNPNVLLTGEVVYIPKSAADAAPPPTAPVGPPLPMPQLAPLSGDHPEAMPPWAAEAPGPQGGAAAQWQTVYGGWPVEGPGLHAGYPPQPQETAAGDQAQAAQTGWQQIPWAYEPYMPHMPQAPLLTEPFSAAPGWGQLTAHPFAQANFPATEAFAQQQTEFPQMSAQQQPQFPQMPMQQQPQFPQMPMQQQPEFPQMPMQQQPEFPQMPMQQQPQFPQMPAQPFDDYMYQYGSYPFLAGHDTAVPAHDMPLAPAHEIPSVPYPYSHLKDCCSGPQLNLPGGFGGYAGYGPSTLPYAAPLMPPYTPGLSYPMQPVSGAHGYGAGAPGGAEPSAGFASGWPGAGMPYMPMSPQMPMQQQAAEFGAIPSYPEGAGAVQIEQKEQDIDITVDERKSAVHTKKVSSSGKQTKPPSQREQLAAYLRSVRPRASDKQERRPNAPWINV